jgi:glutamyl-tRNA reductase
MSEPDVRSESTDLTVIGCGLMGAAVAPLAQSSYRAAARNRTDERAEALAAAGVTPIDPATPPRWYLGRSRCLHA